MTTSALDRWPLVGRSELVERFDEVLEAGGGGLLVSGPAGVGKTRIAEECAALAERSGRRVLRAVASRTAAQLPLGAVAHLLPADVGRAGIDPALIFDRVRTALEDADDRLRPLVVVDDIHLLDVASLTLLAQLVAADLVVLLGTVRSGEAVPDAVTGLWRDGRVERMDVADLDRLDVETLLHLALGGALERPAANALWEASTGNVLFLRELVLGALQSGTLVERGGVWGLTGPLASTGRLVELVEARLGGLDDEARTVLELLAWCQPVGLADLETISELGTLAQLERDGLVVTEVVGLRNECRLGHPVYGEVLRSTTPAVRRRALLRDHIARIRAHGARRREDLFRIATWSLDGGGSADGPLLVQAARVARVAPAYADVVRLARAAMQGGLTGDLAAEAALLLGEALHETGHFDEAEQVLADAMDLEPSEALRLRLVVIRTKNLHWGLVDSERTITFLREAASWDGWSDDSRAELAADEASTLVFSGHPDQAMEVIERIATDDPRVRIVRAIPGAPALSALGRTAEAVAMAEAAFAEHSAMGDELAIANPGTHVVAQVFALGDAGRLAEAEALGRAGYEVAVEANVPIAQIWFAENLGRIAGLQGRVATARAWYQEAVNLAEQVGFRGPLRMAHSGVALGYGLLGDAAGAQAELARRDLLPPFGFLAPEAALADGWAAAAVGDPQAAREILLGAAEQAGATGHVSTEVWLRHDAVRLGDRTSVDRLVELASLSDSTLAAACAAHAAALRADTADALAAAADGFGEIGAHLLAAEAAAEAGDAYRRAGDSRLATNLLRRSEELAARCEGAKTPALVRPEVVVPLSNREREVALLAAEGVPSKVIAERLYLSFRTVNNHLQRVYTKLGVSNRAELAEALGVSPSGGAS